MVCTDVLQNLWWYQSVGGVVLVEALAYLGGADRIFKIAKRLDAGTLLCGQPERFELMKVEAGSAYDDPSCLLKEGGRVLPLWYAEEGVGADDDEDLCAGREFVTQPMQGVDGVGWSAVALGAVDRRCLDAVGACAEQLHHAEAVGEGGVGSMGFEGLDGC